MSIIDALIPQFQYPFHLTVEEFVMDNGLVSGNISNLSVFKRLLLQFNQDLCANVSSALACKAEKDCIAWERDGNNRTLWSSQLLNYSIRPTSPLVKLILNPQSVAVEFNLPPSAMATAVSVKAEFVSIVEVIDFALDPANLNHSAFHERDLLNHTSWIQWNIANIKGNAHYQLRINNPVSASFSVASFHSEISEATASGVYISGCSIDGCHQKQIPVSYKTKIKAKVDIRGYPEF